MDDNERTVSLDEYKKLREQLLREMSYNEQNDNTSFSSGQSSGKIKALTNGHYKESNNQYDYHNDRKAGMVNVLMLSIISFVFECLFLFLSFVIYN